MLTELIMIIGQNKAEIVDALKMKFLLERMGIGVMGIIMREGGNENIPTELVEEILKLKVIANFNINA